MEKKKYLQLPPIEYGEDSNTVKIIWEYLHLDDDAQKAARAELDLLMSEESDSKKGHEEIIRNISAEDLQGYHEAIRETIRETIRECIQQACSLTYLIMKECFFKGRPVEDLIEEMPTGEIMIRAIYELFLTDEDTFFEDLAKSESEGKKFNPYENMTS